MNTIFLINAILFPICLILILSKIYRQDNIRSLSEFSIFSKNSNKILFTLLFLGNFIQGVCCLYFYIHYSITPYILLGTLAGIVGIPVSFFRIDRYSKIHINLTIIALALYCSSMLLVSISLGNLPMLIVATSHMLSIPIGYAIKLKLKLLEVIYFLFFSIWNILLFIYISKIS